MKSNNTKSSSSKALSTRTKIRKIERILGKKFQIPGDEFLEQARFKASFAKQKGLGHTDVLIEFGLAVKKHLNEEVLPLDSAINELKPIEKRLAKILNEDGIEAETQRVITANKSDYLESLIKPKLKLKNYKAKKRELKDEIDRLNSHLEANGHKEYHHSVMLLGLIWAMIIGGTYFDAEAMFNFLHDSLRLSESFAKGGAVFTSLVLLVVGHFVSVTYYFFNKNQFAKWSGALLLILILGVIAYYRITLGTLKTDIYLAFLMSATTGLVVLSGFITHKGSEIRKVKWRLFRANFRDRFIKNRIKYYKLKLSQLETGFENKCKLEAEDNLKDSTKDHRLINGILALAKKMKEQLVQGYTDLKNEGIAQIKRINPKP